MQSYEAWSLPQFGVAHLHRVTLPLQPLPPRSVRLAMRAVALNYRDHLMVEGQYNPRQPLPLVPCSDGSGEVVELGAEVTRWKVGDRVCPIFAQTWISGPPTPERIRATLGGPLPGTLQRFAVHDESALVRAPDYLNWEEAATLPCAAVTAWNGLKGLAPGSTVLVQGTGGVSVFALQLACAAGMRVCVTSSSDAKLQRALQLGASHGVNYREQPQWSKPVRAWCPEGIDCVIEVGGAGTLEQSLRCLKPGGRISMIGILAGAQSPVNVLPILMQQLTVQGVLVGCRDDFGAMNRFLEQRQIRPQVDSTHSWERAPQAWARLVSGQAFGKLVIQVSA